MALRPLWTPAKQWLRAAFQLQQHPACCRTTVLQLSKLLLPEQRSEDDEEEGSASFGQLTRLITCASHGSSIICS